MSGLAKPAIVPTTFSSITDEEFKHFKDVIFSRAGITLNDTKKSLVEGRLTKRLRHYGLTDFSQYITLLNHPENHQERQVMVDLLTTNETYFFREPKHFEFLQTTVFPSFSSAKSVRVWSAACSTGEEPYTLSMLLTEKFGFRNWEIVATDISSRVLDTAQKGVYPLSETEKIPKPYIAKYCLKGVRTQVGNFSLDSRLKQNIQFRSLNLNETLPEIGFFDIIFLRNVMIYFNTETKKEVVNRVLSRLRTGGYFFIGHSETLNNVTNKVKLIKPSIYQKL